MTTRIALILFLIAACAIALDQVYDWGATLFLIKKGMALIEWIKFWD